MHVSKEDMDPGGLLYLLRMPRKVAHRTNPGETGSPEANLHLQAALDATYDRAGYDLDIDHRRVPIPSLGANLSEWVDQFLRSGMRSD
jgi:Protein of unknown function (DUF4058)